MTIVEDKSRNALFHEFLAAQRQNAFLWMPVFLGLGIGLYFALPSEPPVWAGISIFLLTAILIAGNLYLTRQAGLAVLGLSVVAITASGWCAAQLRTKMVTTPALTKSLDPVKVEGTIVSLDSLEEGKGTRVILRDLVIEDLTQDRTPHFIRISIRKDKNLKPGIRISVLAGLNPPSPPVSPGGFDFQRHAFFMRQGAFGFAYSEPKILSSPAKREGIGVWLENFRQTQARHVETIVPHPEAAIVSALLLGERAGIPEETWQDIRAAGLAHVISISGLHIGLIAGGIFFFTRLLMAMVPRFALYHPIKKYAALIALAGCILYAAMVGFSVPTFRSVIMTGLILTAIVLDRSPFSMRLVAFSALLILLTTPEAMTGPSFQMSFAAVAVLIWFYDETRNVWAGQLKQGGIMRRILFYLAGMVMTSLLATIATAPFTLYHFQQFPFYSVIGNLLALPVISFVVMPASVLAYLLMPLGLHDIPLWVMGKGITAMLEISSQIAGWPYASISLAAWPLAALISFVIGGLILMLARGPARALCLIPLAAGCLFVLFHKAPDIMVSSSGKLVMVRLDKETLLLSNRRSDKFTAESWVREAGFEPDQVKLFPKEGKIEAGENSISCDAYGCLVRIKGKTIGLSFDPRTVAEDCARVDLMIATKPSAGESGCDTQLIHYGDLKRKGSHALYLNDKDIRIETVAGKRGERPWTGNAVR